jgi:hypothetical protein
MPGEDQEKYENPYIENAVAWSILEANISRKQY